MFYIICGHGVSAIDGFVQGTIPPYDEYAVLGPENPNLVCNNLAAEFENAFAIVDANNIDGIQSTVPEGNTRTSEGQCVDTSEQPTPPSIDPLTIVLVIFVSLVMAGAVAYLWVTSKRRN